LLRPGARAGNNESHFASIDLDDGEIGPVHHIVTHDDAGEIEELETRASVSILGFEALNFTQHPQETWQDGELQTLSGHNHDVYESSLEHDGESHTAVLSGQSMVVPREAFPMSLWHDRITEPSQLLDLKDFHLMRVEAAESEETIAHDGIAGRGRDVTTALLPRSWNERRAGRTRGSCYEGRSPANPANGQRDRPSAWAAASAGDRVGCSAQHIKRLW
jgi:hypothetical protein